ncbi:hypothetical protein PRO82_001005 [Candidatus Protochlamydia amoebophila]|nr:hypothetical protein [Candidatus Protochlamydia amoebophila]
MSVFCRNFGILNENREWLAHENLITSPEQLLILQSFDAQFIQYFLQALTPHQAVINMVARKLNYRFVSQKKKNS